MKYSIIIPTFNHLEDCLRPCIDSVLQFTDPTDLEIIIVANGCTDGTRQYIETLPDFVKILWVDEPLGYTRATNLGLKYAQGEFIVLFNNDCVLLGQNKNDWLNILEAPFHQQKNVGITGVTKVNCQYSLRKFLIFFCVMIRREVFHKIGLLDESFSPGGGDDIDFCIRAEDAGFKLVQVPEEKTEWTYTTYFPIYHKAEGTFATVPDWQKIFDNNMNKIREKYNVQYKFGNNFERAVIAKNQDIPPREASRYKWARDNIVGTKILEIGCSSGYGLRFLGDIEGLNYLGIDYNKTIVDFAISQFGPYFKHADVNEFQFEQYDTIIAFEILEHIPNGREIAQKLKKYCKCLLTTCPYDEVPGFWGEHHVLHHLKQQDFPDFQYSFMDDNGNISNQPHNTVINLMMMKWLNTGVILNVNETPKPENKSLTVTAYISSKDRYFTTLPMTVSSIISQTLKPQKIVIILDGEHLDLRDTSIYKNLFSLIERNGIAWEVMYGLKKGQVHSHNHMALNATTDLLWRLDDDNIAEPNVLEKLIKYFVDPKVGAVGGLVLDPKMNDPKPSTASNNIKDLFTNQNLQWFAGPHEKTYDVEHLYSTFIYRKEAASHGYCLDLSPVGHREETIFTHEMKRRGWNLLVSSEAITWHVREPSGGIRSYNNPEYYEADEKVFSKKMSEWNLDSQKIKLIILDNGLGDHWNFKTVLPEIREKYKDKKIILAVCYPEVFADEGLQIISIADARNLVSNIDDYNVYKLGWTHNWTGTLADAYRKLYL